MRLLSTPDVARQVGIHPITLERWLASGKVWPEKTVQIGNRTIRLWTSRDVKRLLKFKAASYRKGRGRKKRAATP